MAYYRWSSSNWYIFRNGVSSNKKNCQELSVWFGLDDSLQQIFTYENLLSEYENVCHEKREQFIEKNFLDYDLSFKDKAELDIAIKTFLQDVDTSKDLK